MKWIRTREFSGILVDTKQIKFHLKSLPDRKNVNVGFQIREGKSVLKVDLKCTGLCLVLSPVNYITWYILSTLNEKEKESFTSS